MSGSRSKRLVIDASIARAAGGPDATFPKSKRCRDFLLDVLDARHRVVMTADIRAEWQRHQSGYARRWLVSMHARKNVHWDSAVVADDALRARIVRTATGGSAEQVQADREAMLKDCCLLEAALAADKTITSLDERVRRLFGAAAHQVGELREIVWANPDLIEERCSDWLREGAHAERKRQLGYREE
jgi:hypothetical protein